VHSMFLCDVSEVHHDNWTENETPKTATNVRKRSYKRKYFLILYVKTHSHRMKLHIWYMSNDFLYLSYDFVNSNPAYDLVPIRECDPYMLFSITYESKKQFSDPRGFFVC
jgi:hypothetical protein